MFLVKKSKGKKLEKLTKQEVWCLLMRAVVTWQAITVQSSYNTKIADILMWNGIFVLREIRLFYFHISLRAYVRV